MLWWIVENTIFAGVLAVIVATLCTLGRLRPGICHVLWIVVLIKLAMPPVSLGFWPPPGLRLAIQEEYEHLQGVVADAFEPAADDGEQVPTDLTAVRIPDGEDEFSAPRPDTSRPDEPDRRDSGAPAVVDDGAIIVDQVPPPRASTLRVATGQVATPQAETREVAISQVETPQAETPQLATLQVSPPGVSIPRVSTPQNSTPRVTPSRMTPPDMPVDVPQVMGAGRASVADQPEADETANRSDRASSSYSWLLGLAAAVLWLIGTTMLIYRQAKGFQRLRGYLAAADAAPPRLLRRIREASRRLGMTCPSVSVSASISSPVVVALGRPHLLWPVSLQEANELEGWESVIMHELAHVQRRDHWTAWGLMITGWFWWWNPVYLVARRQIEDNAELACDAWAVWARPEDRAAYAGALVEITRQSSNALSGVPAIGATRGDFLSLQRRLSMILRHNTPHQLPRWAMASMAFFLMIVLPTWSQGVPTPSVVAAEVLAVAVPETVQADADWSLEDEVRREVLESDAQQAWRAESWDDAIELYRRLLELDEQDAGHWGALAFALLQNGKTEDARRAYMKMEEFGGARSYTQYNIACCYARQGDKTAAFQALNRAIDAGWDSVEHIIQDEDLDGLFTDDRIDALIDRIRSIENTLHDAYKQANRGENEAGRDLLDAMPYNPNIPAKLAKGHLHAEQFVLAATVYERLAEIRHDRGNALYDAACAYALGGETSRALDALELAIADGFLKTEHMRKDNDLDSLRGNRRFERLLDVAGRTHVEQRNRDGSVHLLVNVRAADWNEARAKYETLCEIFPHDRHHWDNLGTVLMRLGEPEAALEAYGKLRIRRRNGRETMNNSYNMAWAYGEAGQVEKGIDVLIELVEDGLAKLDYVAFDPDIEALRQHPRFEEVLERVNEMNDLERLARGAREEYDNQRYAEAARGYQAALQMSPRDGGAIQQLGLALLLDNRPEEALRVFQRQVDLRYHLNDAYYNLGCALARLGRTNQAFEALELALRHGWHNMSHLKRDSDLESLHDDERWQRYLERK